MADNKMEKDILLKTSVMGFDKKSVMDFIENIQIENEELKRKVNALASENSELLRKIESLEKEQSEAAKIEEYASMPDYDEEDTFVTVEDLSLRPYEEIARDKKPVIKAKKAPSKVKIAKKSK